jgi:pSer/pThr/pTyr-binding forkhead associated (FHA) protein
MLALRFSNGPRSGQSIIVGTGQKLTIGRTDAADYAVVEDSFISSRHFELTCRLDGVGFLRDLQSRNGTYVNGQQVHETQLFHGDVVRAGGCEFRVEMKGVIAEEDNDRVNSRSSPSAHPESSVRPTAIRDEPPAPTRPMPTTHAADQSPIFVQTNRLPSGAAHFTPIQDAPLPMELLRQLSNLTQLSAILSPPVSDYRLQTFSQPLLNWLPRHVSTRISPVILHNSDEFDVLALIEQYWGQDRVVCVLSAAHPDTVVRQLTTTARGQTRPSGIPDTQLIIADWRPSQLMPRLVQSPEIFCKPLFEVITAFIMKDEPKDRWQVIAHPKFETTLAHIGLMCGHP